MRTLLTKSFIQVFISTLLVLTISIPFFFLLMEEFYTSDLDEVVWYNTKQFKQEKIPLLSHIDIKIWNKYNPDIQILEFNPQIELNTPFNETHINRVTNIESNYRVLYTLIQLDNYIHILQVKAPMINTRELMENIAVQHSLILLFILIILLILHRTNSHKLWKPFYNTLDQLKKFNIEKNEIPTLPQTSIYEFNQLNNHLNLLIQKVTESYKSHKQFIENASHELQTPIAILKSQLDLLLQEENLSEGQMEILNNLYNTTSRLSKLNKTLLLLAKLENEQFEDKELIQLDTLINEHYKLFTELAVDSNVQIFIETQPVSMVTNKSLIEIVISNLMSNALRYNKSENGLIFIKLTEDSLTISNTSNQHQLTKEALFIRFSKQRSNLNGNGLGLAIVNQICHYNNWEILYNYNDDVHQFTIKF